MRYVQRVLKVTVPLPSGAGRRTCAALHAAAVGRSVEDIQREIMTPGMEAAIAAGFPEVSTRSGAGLRFRAKIDQPAGLVATILDPHPHPGGKIAMLTRAEARREHGRHLRRQARGVKSTAAPGAARGAAPDVERAAA